MRRKLLLISAAISLSGCAAFSQLVTSDPAKQQAIQQFGQEATCVGQATVNAVAETQTDPKVKEGLSAASQVLGYGCGGVIIQPVPQAPVPVVTTPKLT